MQILQFLYLPGDRLTCLHWFCLSMSLAGLLVIIQPHILLSWGRAGKVDRKYYVGAALATIASITSAAQFALLGKCKVGKMQDY